MNNNTTIYKEKLKENIKELVNKNRLAEAKEILVQYEKIVKNDIDVYSIGSVIAIMEGDMELAENVLKTGLGIDNSNFNLLYNLAYVYQSTEQKELAIEYYKKAMQNANAAEDVEEVYKILQLLDVKESKECILQDILVEEDKKEIETKTDSLDEMESYKKQFKKNIEILVEQGLLKEAKDALNEYEKIVKDDVDVYSIKGVIAMLEGDMDGAEYVLDKGILVDSNNKDLLYNIAYLYKNAGKINKSIYFFKKLYYRTVKQDTKKEIEQIIKTLGGNITQKILIGSPIYQKPHILREFLKSLKELNKDNLDVSYYFVDDNSIQESSELLKQFKDRERNVFIFESENDDIYICDENTHNWRENLIWKVAKFKDKIIKYAKDNNFDYLFFLDSDLILYPQTLKHLISTGKDIISEIFWTKWKSYSFPLPQVWLSDTYTQHHALRDEKLHITDIAIRHKEFIERLKKPGIYEVGGLGACTLISKYAIDKGVSFKEIRNLSFWGEDRHFCIRAASLGIPLYVDTYYPAYHIYREADLCGVDNYKRFGSNVNKKKVALVYTNLSGSNTVAMYKLTDQNIKDKYHISLVPGDMSAESLNTILGSDIAIFTEGNYPFTSKLSDNSPIVMDLWHGLPLKAMGYADKGEKFKDLIEGIWDNVDYITSYSPLFNRLMGKCISADLSKYMITGAQRNDLLFCTDGRKNIELLFGEDYKNKKFVFYMPTYRYTSRGNKTEGNRNWENIFGFRDFNMDKFVGFLKANNIIFFAKLHPAEESKFINKIPVNENIKVITNELLLGNGMELYETLNSADVLITDYSSVYIDLLLLDIPAIFTPIDIEEYRNDRGLILEPYEHWTPGPKCITQKSLQDAIGKFLLDPTYYKNERKDILYKTHKYIDGNSSQRTWNLIEKVLSK